jgi:hypothetical protein
MKVARTFPESPMHLLWFQVHLKSVDFQRVKTTLSSRVCTRCPFVEKNASFGALCTNGARNATNMNLLASVSIQLKFMPR